MALLFFPFFLFIPRENTVLLQDTAVQEPKPDHCNFGRSKAVAFRESWYTAGLFPSNSEFSIEDLSESKSKFQSTVFMSSALLFSSQFATWTFLWDQHVHSYAGCQYNLFFFF